MNLPKRTAAYSFFWLRPSSIQQAQIHLLGNALTWASANVAAVVYVCLSLWYLVRRRRKIYDIPEGLTPLGVAFDLLNFNRPKTTFFFSTMCLAITFSCPLTLTLLFETHKSIKHHLFPLTASIAFESFPGRKRAPGIRFTFY